MDGASPAPAAAYRIPGRGAQAGLPEAQSGSHQSCARGGLWLGICELRMVCPEIKLPKDISGRNGRPPIPFKSKQIERGATTPDSKHNRFRSVMLRNFREPSNVLWRRMWSRAALGLNKNELEKVAPLQAVTLIPMALPHRE